MKKARLRALILTACAASVLLLTTSCDDDTNSSINGNGTITGVLSDTDGNPVGGASVNISNHETTSDYNGAYTIDQVPAGSHTLEVKADWFAEFKKTIDVLEGENTEDASLSPLNLNVTDADKALANSYSSTFDWTVDTVSIHYIPTPSRAELDKAVYYRNPALYPGAYGENVTPSPIPSIDGGVATGFAFVLNPKDPTNALDESTIVDSIEDTPLTAAEISSSVLWEPAIKIFLTNSDQSAAQGLYDVGLAIEGQFWEGASAANPQKIEHTYLHNEELWIEISFEKWLLLGQGISDTNGDGKPEIYARILADHYESSTLAKLKTEYIDPSFDTLEMAANLRLLQDDLYSRTNPSIIHTLGTPYKLEGIGTIEYPFAVIEHSTGVINVLLIEP